MRDEGNVCNKAIGLAVGFVRMDARPFWTFGLSRPRR